MHAFDKPLVDRASAAMRYIFFHARSACEERLMKSQVFAATLLLAALPAPAHAGLGIARFAVIASASALDTGVGGGVEVELRDLEPYSLPFTLLATERKGGSFGAALQDKGGFFRDQANVAVTEYFTNDIVRAGASTLYHVVVSTDQPDTPLTVNFNFFGASADAVAQYREGHVDATIMASIGAERRTSNDRLELLERDAEVWTIYREIDLREAVTGRSVDTQGIGLPSEHFAWGYRPMSFDYEEKLTLDAFSGTLDFGVLQPGEFFAFQYSAFAQIDADSLKYTGRANALLVDPFSLASPPQFQFSIAGFALPTSPVPEPTSALLMLVGLGWLGWRRMRWSQLSGAAA